MLKCNQNERLDCYNELFNSFSAFCVLSGALKNEILATSNLLRFSKKHRLLSEKETSGSIYFIVKGAIRIFYLNEDGNEINTWFLFENELAISVYSFFTGNPSFENIETLEDTLLIVLKKQKLEELYQKYLEFNIVGRKLTELYYIRNEIQANSLRMMSAKERYIQLLKTQPQVIRRIALGHIASYLGISSETLSRIRKQI